MLSTLFPMVNLSGTSLRRGLMFVAFVGAFFWTSHVLAFVAKQTVPDMPSFVAMETIYLAIQFGVYGLFLALIHRDRGPV